MGMKKENPDFQEALARNRTATDKFEAMTDYARQSVLQWAEGIDSEQQMQQLVENIAQSETHGIG